MARAHLEVASSSSSAGLTLDTSRTRGTLHLLWLNRQSGIGIVVKSVEGCSACLVLRLMMPHMGAIHKVDLVRTLEYDSIVRPPVQANGE